MFARGGVRTGVWETRTSWTVGSGVFRSLSWKVLPMRVSTAFFRLLCLPGVWVRSVKFERGRVLVTVALRARLLRCPQCSYSTRHRESQQHHDSVWRHLDLGVRRLEIHARLRRLVCPDHGALVEGVPFTRDGARFTTDFEDLVAWLMTKCDRTTTCRLTRIDWHTVCRERETTGRGERYFRVSSVLEGGWRTFSSVCWCRRSRAWPSGWRRTPRALRAAFVSRRCSRRPPTWVGTRTTGSAECSSSGRSSPSLIPCSAGGWPEPATGSCGWTTAGRVESETATGS